LRTLVTRLTWALVLLAVGTIFILCVLSLQRRSEPGDEGRVSNPSSPAERAARIERGRYLTRIGNCMTCHTRPGGEPFAGGVAFGTPYASLGTLYSTNITPHREKGIGAWTEAQFVRALREGKAPGRGRLFPAFPYTSFTLLTREDAGAIFAYLSTIEPASDTPPENSLVFTWRWGMALWNGLFFEAERFRADASRSAEWNRGAYLVNGLGHCGACHTPRNALLAEEADAALSGGSYSELIGPDRRRTWFAVNLTSAASGLGAWSVRDVAAYLKTGHSRRAGIFGPMNEVVVNSLQYLSDADAQAMAVYLKSLPPLGESDVQTPGAGDLQAGAAIYTEHCEECHRSSGRGAFLKAPPLAGSAVVQGRDPATLINVILHGAQVGRRIAAGFGAWEDMKSFADTLADEEVAAVATYVRASWGNRGGVVTTANVTRAR
jgi:alcohol dehydrogenase (quinone), cytochrome c subunit